MTMQPDHMAKIDDAATLVLGIETSCDETAAAVVRGAHGAGGTILANRVLSQIEEHKPFGGVVPEIAARSHLDHLDHLIEAAMQDAGIGFSDLDAVAATGGPGLIGGVMVGVMAAKSIALARSLPFIAVNHLEAHALTVRLTDNVAFPYLLLLISGGHCQLLIVEGVGAYRRLGTTIDDALGEAFDKTAKLLGLGYPGGPLLERAAKAGTPGAVGLPRPMKGRPGCNFSFSGLKTAVRQTYEKHAGKADEQFIADVALAFHEAAADVLGDRCAHAIETFRERHPEGRTLVVAGGVAANRYLRGALDKVAGNHALNLIVAPPALCTDNAAMVAWAGFERFRLGLTDPLDFKPRPRWPLDADAPKVDFAGIKA